MPNRDYGHDLKQAICDYLLWMISSGYAKSSWNHYERVLNHFSSFVSRREIPWEDIFTLDTLKAFQQESGLTSISSAIKGLSRYLFKQGKISCPLQKKPARLPEVYEEYLIYYAKLKEPHPLLVLRSRRVLSAFFTYLKKAKVPLPNLEVKHLDAFLAEYNAPFVPQTRQNHRSCLRGFLDYLYHEPKIVKRDLAHLLVGAPVFAQTKPPRFLRAQEVQKLLAGLKSYTSWDLRAYAMIHIAFSLGLRPCEISLLTLDDISFSQKEVSLRKRKSENPIKLPLPESTIKAIAAYVIGARPKSSQRAVFLSFRVPHAPVSPAVVSKDISTLMRKENLPSSAYWLRHTYAQNLLENGATIFEIKEMLGHDQIQTTEHYISVDTKLMREVLFDETL
ncbi:MAG: tyrosine-type recombinase/integrase [Candidatus Omnitrophota bacterium]